MNNLKILHLSLSYNSAPNLGGPDITVYKLCSSLAKKGATVDVICTNLASKDSYISKSSFSKKVDGVNVNYLRTLKILPLGTSSFGLYYIPELKDFLSSNIKNYDIVHLHGYRDYLSLIGALQAKSHNVPYVLHPRGTLPNQGHSILVKKLFDYSFGKIMIKNASGLIALTKREINSFRLLNADINKITVVNNGMDLDDYNPYQSGENFINKYKITQKFIVLYLGRVHKIKGIDHMVKAVADLSRIGFDIAAVVVGPDEGFAKVLKNIANEEKFTHLYLIPTVTGLEKQQAFGAADVLVYAAEVEDFGVVAFEGILSGVPTIVASETGCGEIFKRYNLGHTVPYGDINQLSKLIKELLETPNKSKEFTMAGSS